jgi:hypothetical protein
MKKYSTALIVSLIMLSAILGITNPGFKAPHQFFDDVEGKVIHNYFIFSVYKQFNGHSISADGKYIIYKRYLGIALKFYEISPVREEKKENTESDNK